MLIKKNMAISPLVALLFVTVVIYGIPIQSAAAVESGGIRGAIGSGREGAPIAISANNVYIAWNNNDTGHWNVFFVKSSDGGKTFGKNIMLNAPHKGHVVDQNVQIAASGSNVYVTWWTNKTGVLMPVFRASSDSGNTFGKTIMLNSTG
jgi:hypothetical protein